MRLNGKLSKKIWDFYKNGVFLGPIYVFVLMKCVNTNVGRLNLFHKAEVVYMSVNPHKRLMSSGLVGRLNL